MPELVAGDAESAAWIAAADERYRNLRTHLFVGLSETCTTDHCGRAADAAAALVLPELKSVYVGYLAAKDERDELRQRVAEFEAQEMPDTSVSLGPCATCGTPFEACEISSDEPEYATDANGNHDGLCCEDCHHHATACPTGCDDGCETACHEEHEVPAKRQHVPWQHSELNRLRERVADLEQQVAEATAALSELAPLSTATERDDYAKRIERALEVIEDDISMQAASVRLALTIPSAQQDAADELTRLGEEIGD